jgi:hypothetical protein
MEGALPISINPTLHRRGPGKLPALRVTVSVLLLLEGNLLLFELFSLFNTISINFNMSSKTMIGFPRPPVDNYSPKTTFS